MRVGAQAVGAGTMSALLIGVPTDVIDGTEREATKPKEPTKMTCQG